MIALRFEYDMGPFDTNTGASKHNECAGQSHFKLASTHYNYTTLLLPTQATNKRFEVRAANQEEIKKITFNELKVSGLCMKRRRRKKQS